MHFKVDRQSAIDADNFIDGFRLTEGGKHIGHFTRAEHLISQQKGTHGIGFTFESRGKSCDFTLWLSNASQSERYFGHKQLSSILTCLGIREIDAQDGPVERYNHNLRKRETVTAKIYPALLDKPIGIVFQRCEYINHKNERAWRLEYYTTFRATDELTSGEIMLKIKEPCRLAEVLAKLTDKPYTGNVPQAYGAGGYRQENTYQADKEWRTPTPPYNPPPEPRPEPPPEPQPSSSGFDMPDDDIPF